MNNKTLMRAKKIFSGVLSVSLAVSSICLIFACVSIYLSGDKPFSREAVAIAFSPISIPVYISILLVLIDIVLCIILPKAKEKAVVDTKSEMYLSRLMDTRNAENAEPSVKDVMAKEKRKRKFLYVTTLIVCVICAIPFLVYALNGENFHRSEINDSMIKAMTLLIPCYAVSVIYAIVSAYLSRASRVREAAVLKTLPSTKKDTLSVKKINIKLIAAIIFIVCAAALITLGALTGGTADVLTKAVNICTECIGLG